FKTREEAKTKIFDWIHWYNHKRIHSSINYLSPIAFEALADARLA
ncbi:MAG: IS3 family transposase, partial [Firmicutes bacterium]|nr:IS3 family transposase [Bacillota bacterium]